MDVSEVPFWKRALFMYSCVVSALAVFLFVVQMACAHRNKSSELEHSYVPIQSQDIEDVDYEATTLNSYSRSDKVLVLGKEQFHSSSYQNCENNLEIVALPTPLKNLMVSPKSNFFS